MSRRLLHVITGLTVGGAEQALAEILRSGLAEETEAKVLCLTPPGPMAQRIIEAGVPVESLEAKGSVLGPNRLRKLIQTTREFRPDTVQGWMYHGNLAAWLARSQGAAKARLFWNVRHSLYSLREEKPLTRWVIRAHRGLSRGATAIVYNSAVSREQHEAFGFPAARGQVIPNGFDLEKYRPDPVARNEIRAQLAIPSGALVIGQVARFHPMKGHRRLLEAARNLLQSDRKVHLMLVGRNVDRDNPALREAIANLPRSQVHLPGERSDVRRWYNAMDGYVQSSEWGEAFPNALGEAMATGLPCIATDVGDSAILLGETGSLVPRTDDGALREALAHLVAQSEPERQRAGAKARRRIAEKFSLATCVEAYRTLYGLPPEAP